MAKKNSKPELPQMPTTVPQFVIEKAELLAQQVRALGHPRAVRQDIVGALIYAATPAAAAKALKSYNPKLGHALDDLDGEIDRWRLAEPEAGP